jgi:hypothetical protein
MGRRTLSHNGRKYLRLQADCAELAIPVNATLLLASRHGRFWLDFDHCWLQSTDRRCVRRPQEILAEVLPAKSQSMGSRSSETMPAADFDSHEKNRAAKSSHQMNEQNYNLVMREITPSMRALLTAENSHPADVGFYPPRA